MRAKAEPPPTQYVGAMSPSFRSTLWRVLLMQLIALCLLGALQLRYHLVAAP